MVTKSFGRYLHLFSCLLILIGFSSILITSSYLISVGIGVGSTLLYLVFGERLTRLSPPRWFWNLSAIVLLLYFTYNSLFGDLDLVGNAISFVVYLQTVKILSPKADRDWFQIYLLSFLHILASTTLSTDMTFALPFIAYLLIAIWTLTLFNIKVQQAASTDEGSKARAVAKLMASTHIVTPRFFTVTTALSVLILFFAMIIFFIFPRVSMKNFLRRVSAKQDISGFSGEVELGTIGNIKNNNTIALRIELPANTLDQIDIEQIYWRGTASDHFDGRRWTQSFTDRKNTFIDMDENILKENLPNYPGQKILEYGVLLEALSTPILFGADRLHRVIWDKPAVERFLRRSLSLDHSEEYGSYHFQSSQPYVSDLTYRAESLIGSPPSDLLRAAPQEYPYSIRETYLQLPKMTSDVENLLASIPMAGTTPYDRVQSLLTFLEKNYRYTVNVQDAGVSNPLKFFFLDRKRGHCEYFSTALIVALRFYGIPARQVVGFRGGEYNPIGNYLAVRQNHAHSWAEVYFPKYGWLRFDPSPPDSIDLSAQSGFLKSFLQMTDYLRLRWNKYIVEYDLRAQAGVIESLGKLLSSKFSRHGKTGPSIESDELGNEKTPEKKGWAFFPVYIVLILALVPWAFWWIRKSKRKVVSHFFYARVLKRLKRWGLSRFGHETPLEFAARIENLTGSYPSLITLSKMYYAERFGGQSFSLQEWKKQLDEFRSSESTLKKARSESIRRQKTAPKA